MTHLLSALALALALAAGAAVPVVAPPVGPAAPDGGGLVLIGPRGSAPGQICLPASPSWMEAAAAAEIAARLLQATGATLPVVSEPTATVEGTPTLFVGRTLAGAALPHPPLKPEGYSVIVSAGAGYVLGDDHCNASWPHKTTDNSECRRGTLFGAFALLRHLGFAWLWPGSTGEVTPSLTTAGVALSAGLNLSDAPELAMRRYRPIYSNTAEVYGR